MDFWILAVLIAVLVAAILVLAVWRGRKTTTQRNDIAIYKTQLAGIERDQARGVLSADDAERARVEVQRRLLDADRGAHTMAGSRGGKVSWLALALLGAGLIGGTFAIYQQLGAVGYPDLPLSERLAAADERRANRPDQTTLEARAGLNIDPNADPRHLDLVQKLRDALASRPGDTQGLELLARNEAALGNYPAAHAALARILQIKGEDATAQDWSDYADMQIVAAGGIVSEQAEVALSQALRLDPDNGAARYYVGLMYAQTGRPDRAFNFWSNLLSTSKPDDPWVGPIRAGIETLAADAGQSYTLPPLAPGPSQDDVNAAAEMSEADRAEMIQGMVERLSSRLANEGGPPEDWARLINALGVLGNRERAAAIWQEAQVIFGADPAAIATVRAAAQSAGVAP